MIFSIDNPLNQLSDEYTTIFDAHTHVWGSEKFDNFHNWASKYGVNRLMAIATPDIRKELIASGYDNLVFAFYLSSSNFAEYNTKEILKEIDLAHENEYSIIKSWFGPRFLDFSNAEGPFRLNNYDLDPIFSRIEDYDLMLEIHVADPDAFYDTVYTDKKRYGTKEERINDFREILSNHKSMRTKSVHFGSLPEDLDTLSHLLDDFNNLYIDTASTRWIIRELGKDIEKTRNWFNKYYDRVLFATDLSVGWTDRDDYYFASRYWSQRIFFETSIKTELPFKDDSNPNGTMINGLNLDKKILDHLYFKNAEKLFLKK